MGDHWHLSDVPLPDIDHDRMMQEAVASLAEAETIQRQTLLSLNGLITFTLLDDDAVIDTARRGKRDEWSSSDAITPLSAPPSFPASVSAAASTTSSTSISASPSPSNSIATHPVANWFQNTTTTTYDTPATVPVPIPNTQVSVLDGGPRAYADRIIWQPTSAHPDLNARRRSGESDLNRRRKEEDEEYESEDYNDEDHNDRNVNGDTWTRDLGWQASIRGRGSCCDWIGVTCDDYERVIGIKLQDVGLEGKMSDDLFVLDQLVRL